MPFIKYTERGRSYAPKASISRSGMLSFSEGARRRFDMDKYSHCVLYYDPEDRKVGLQLTNDADAEGARKLRLRTTGADVAAKSCVDYFDLMIGGTTSYSVDLDVSTGYVTIDLNTGKSRAPKSRRLQLQHRTP